MFSIAPADSAQNPTRVFFQENALCSSPPPATFFGTTKKVSTRPVGDTLGLSNHFSAMSSALVDELDAAVVLKGDSGLAANDGVLSDEEAGLGGAGSGATDIAVVNVLLFF